MRVLFCKIHSPFICFCKPTSHIYTSGPLKLENSPNLSSKTTVVSVGDIDRENIEVKEDSVVDGKKWQKQGEEEGENCVKSSLKKEDSKVVQRKQVQWMDFLGKELVTIREFEASETEETDNDSESGKGSVCIIL